MRAHLLDEVIEARRLLDHPFYKAWAAGTLTEQDLSFYATQYWRQVEAFPGYLENLQRRLAPGAARDVVTSNLRDERDDDHPGLWLRFAGAVGALEAEVRGTGAEPETALCVDTFKKASRSAPTPFALGMLYAYESQTPEVAQTKVEGLREHYGIDGAPVEYFELHGELDVEHSRDLLKALDDVIEDEADEQLAVEGARAGAAAVYGLLDGVARVRDIDC